MTRTNDSAATHVRASLSHLEAAKVARLALEDAYARRPQDKAEIADLHQSVGFGLKVAEIHALLALAPAAPSPATGAAYADVTDLNSERFGRGSRLS
jgi:hypothetical protein